MHLKVDLKLIRGFSLSQSYRVDICHMHSHFNIQFSLCISSDSVNLLSCDAIVTKGDPGTKKTNVERYQLDLSNLDAEASY